MVKKKTKVKKPVYKRWWFWLIAVCIIGYLVPTSNNISNQTALEPTIKDEINTPSPTTQIEYDPLMSIFTGISAGTTAKDIDAVIKQYSLEFTCHDRHQYTSYRIGYEKDVVLQSYGESGDYLDVDFDNDNGAFMYAVYFNNSSFANAILFSYGDYFDLHGKAPGNPKSGYYSHIPGKDYVRCQTAEEAINKVFQKAENNK